MKHRSRSWTVKALARTLVASLAGATMPPAPALATPARPQDHAEDVAVEVDRTTPATEPAPDSLQDGLVSDEEVFRTTVFTEPLVPMDDQVDATENRALLDALRRFRERRGPDDYDAVLHFLSRRPDSRWRAALLFNLGVAYRLTGRLSLALDALEQAWTLGKPSQRPDAQRLASAAVGELALMNGRLGREDRLDRLFAEIEGRPLEGNALNMVSAARKGRKQMEMHPELSFRCGPFAVDRLRAAMQPGLAHDLRALAARSTSDGTSLAQAYDLAQSLGLSLQTARRSPGAAILVPAVMHWKVGHFSAIVRELAGLFQVDDPTFGYSPALTPSAIDDEASGYFLVRSGPLPDGWQAIETSEAQQVWGKGHIGNLAPGATGSCDPKVRDCSSGGCGARGMPVWNAHAFRSNLNVVDTPLEYAPPRGPAVSFTVTFNQQEAFQPANFTYSNLGQRWVFDWLAYVTDKPSDPYDTLSIAMRGGGTEDYTYSADTGTWVPSWPHRKSGAELARIGADHYERLLPDGSKEIYSQSDGGVTERKLFLKEMVDPAGNKVILSYDGLLRLETITDALSQVTTFHHDLGSDVYKVTKVTDPFGRSVLLTYSPFGRLESITDPLGMRSTFAYSGDSMASMTTPYGTTQFSNSVVTTLEVTDPMGAKERVEFKEHCASNNCGDVLGETDASVPTDISPSTLNLREINTFYWDKRAMALYPGDYSKAAVMQWRARSGFAVPVLSSTKQPLENRIWHYYPGEPDHVYVGTSDFPAKTTRVLGLDGSGNKIEPSRRYEHNSRGHVTKYTDPVGRETLYEYALNGIDLLFVKQKNPGSPGGYDLLRSTTYNAQHLPLTVTDAAGQTTTYAYNAAGQLKSVTTPPRAGITESRTTTYTYDGNGYLVGITGPQPGTTSSFGYDAHGRLRTTTDSDGYTVTLDYDALNRIIKTTYPDSTYEETVYNRLDAMRRRDRLGRWAETFYDAERRVLAERDAEDRTTLYDWCACGSLDGVTDPNGNKTAWERDVQGRIVRETRANGLATLYEYEATTSRLKTITDRKGQFKTYGYHLDDNINTITYPNPQHPTPNVTLAYDPNYNRMVSRIDGAGTTTYSYHPIQSPPALGAGRPSTVTGSGTFVAYAYDELGRRVGGSVGLAGQNLTWSYDSLGRLVSRGGSVGTFTLGYVGTSGRLSRLTYPNGQTSDYAYYPNSGDKRLSQIHHRASVAGPTLSKFDYGYDAAGTITGWTQQYGASPANAYDFDYDAVDQLKAAAHRTTVNPPAILKRYNYAYDAAGNRTGHEEIVGTSATVLGATYNNLNQLVSRQAGGPRRFVGTTNEPATVTVAGSPAQTTAADNRFEGEAIVGASSTVAVTATDASANQSVKNYQVTSSGTGATYTYDNNGNLVQTEGSVTTTYDWDAEDRLVRVAQGSTELARFSYDALGRRYQKITGTTTRTYVYDGDDLVQERLTGGATATIRYFPGPGIDRPLARIDGPTVEYYLADHLGSIVQMTNASSAVTLTRQYDPWGTLLQGGTTSGYAFTGREWDPETGLYYYRARYYDPKIGRFLGEDPIGFLGGDVNLFAYVFNNPVNLTDPSGLIPVTYPNPEPGTPPGPPRAPCGFIVGAKAFGVMKSHGTRFTHCWASCEIAKACGQQAAEDWQDIKEWYDWGVCGLPGFSKNCDSAFQPDDYYDNQTGRSCPAAQSCWDRCRPLMGAPDPPPGPYGR